jgi:hypothetical protein
LRGRGYLVGVVERWIALAGVRRNLFGFADILAVHVRDRAFLIVQATTVAHVADRLDQARARPELAAWLRAGGAFEAWGWRQSGRSWRVKVAAVRAEDLAAVVVEAPPVRRGGRKWWPLPHPPPIRLPQRSPGARDRRRRGQEVTKEDEPRPLSETAGVLATTQPYNGGPR